MLRLDRVKDGLDQRGHVAVDAPHFGFRPAVIEVLNQKPRPVGLLFGYLAYRIGDQTDILPLLESQPIDLNLPTMSLFFGLRYDSELFAKTLRREPPNALFS